MFCSKYFIVSFDSFDINYKNLVNLFDRICKTSSYIYRDTFFSLKSYAD